jgi:hypothetical protein
MGRWALLAAVGLTVTISSAMASAQPAKIIILRHGEKKNGHELCTTGTLRAQALAAQFLGRNATPALLSEPPAAVLAITLHTIETATPAALTWGLQPQASPMPGRGKGEEKDSDLDEATKAAAQDVLTNPVYEGKTVIMVWEHKRIASEEHNAARTSLRTLLHLDQATNPPPKKWEGENYNFFWIVTYGPRNLVMVDTSQDQAFTGKFFVLPDNGWGEPEQNKRKDCE